MTKIVDEVTGEVLFSGTDEELESELAEFAALFTDLVGAALAISESYSNIPPDQKIKLALWAGRCLTSLTPIIEYETSGEDNEEVN